MSKLILSSLLIFPIILSNIVKSEDSVGVRIKNGLIYGKRHSFGGRDYNQFLGIPYAEPPIGDLRFKKSVPKGEWKTPLEAYEWPNSCVHIRFNRIENYFSDRMSENCLYLNIWSPITPESDSGLKPVMFFIHGGGLYFGSSSENSYSGHVLATKGEVVVVTINYRLNIFGLLYTGTDIGTGNMGLWDQALALEWVKDNIEYFGGDSNRITVFGESAGAWSTSLHILSPVTRNMFQNAIVMSSAAVNNITVCTPEAVLDMWKQKIEDIGCVDQQKSEQSKNKFTPKMIECLSNTAPEVLAAIPTLGFHYCMNSLIIDGQLIADSPSNSLKTGDHKKNFNLLIGTTEDEGSFLLNMFVDPKKYDKHAPKVVTYEESYTDLVNLFNHLPFGIKGEDIAKVYFNGLSDNNSADLLRRTVGIAFGDFLIGCPTIFFAKKIHSNDLKSNVYQYHYNSKAGDPKLFCANWMGVCHFDDIYPVFGVPFYDFDRYVDKEREISDQMIDIFSTFAKTGRPPAQRSAEWHSYYKLNDKTIAPFYEITSEPKVNTNFGLGLKLSQCEYLWQKYYISR